MTNQNTSKFLLVFCWLHVPLIGIIAWAAEVPVLWPVAMAAGLSLLATVDLHVSQARGKVTLACALISQPAVMVAIMANHPWQVDMHMYFFALMAVLSLLSNFPVSRLKSSDFLIYRGTASWL